MSDKIWLSAHLYYSSNLHKFLVEAIRPFKNFVLNQGLAENYFFIRYWEKGPHIRLRFKGNPDILHNDLKPQLNDFFENYYSKFPSKRTDKENLYKKYFKSDIFFPNNSVQYIDYEPEIERYGGEKGILISEKLFEMSSDAALEILSNTDFDNYEETGQRAIGAAIQLHLSALFAFKMNNIEISSLFDEIFNDWAPAAYKVFSKNENLNFTLNEKIFHNKYLTDIFDKQTNQLKPIIQPFITEFFEALGNNYLFEEEWINKWLIDMKSIREKLTYAINRNEIVTPDHYKHLQPDILKNKLSYLLKSYMHMTNNRVGVLNHNESFIAYLIIKYLQD